MVKQGFTAPKLHDRGGDIKKDWYVAFNMTNPVTFVRKPFQMREGINYYKTKAERYSEGKALCSILKKSLEDGWNPFELSIKEFLYVLHPLENEPVPLPQLTIDDYKKNPKLMPDMPLNMALDFAYTNKEDSLGAKSRSTYRSVKDYAKQAAIALQFDGMKVSEVKRGYIKLILEQMAKDRTAAYLEEYNKRVALQICRHGTYKVKKVVLQQFTGNNYNKYKQFLHILFTELEECDAIEYNPCAKIIDKPEIKTNIHRHATVAEEKLIKDTLKVCDFNFYVYLAIEELSGIRPVEIYGLQICDIDWFNQSFDIHATEGRSKTRTTRKVPIPNTLMPLINALKLERYDPNFYIFSEAMKPGAVRIKRDKATKKWKTIVKDGLGLDVSMYSFKGLGGDKKRDAGIDKQSVSTQMGHTKTTTTDIYLEREDERQRRVIIENTPAFHN